MSQAHIPKALRDRVTEQARRRCGYCLTPEAIVGVPMEVDHIFPEALGGETVEENLWLACGPRNNHKNCRVVGLDPQTQHLVRLFDPRAQLWAEHFAWSKEGDLIIGLTATGRATVVAVNLNRPPLVKARQLWASVGWHPPKD